jgi:hypothetical protein
MRIAPISSRRFASNSEEGEGQSARFDVDCGWDWLCLGAIADAPARRALTLKRDPGSGLEMVVSDSLPPAYFP